MLLYSYLTTKLINTYRQKKGSRGENTEKQRQGKGKESPTHSFKVRTNKMWVSVYKST